MTVSCDLQLTLQHGEDVTRDFWPLTEAVTVQQTAMNFITAHTGIDVLTEPATATYSHTDNSCKGVKPGRHPRRVTGQAIADRLADLYEGEHVLSKVVTLHEALSQHYGESRFMLVIVAGAKRHQVPDVYDKPLIIRHNASPFC